MLQTVGRFFSFEAGRPGGGGDGQGELLLLCFMLKVQKLEFKEKSNLMHSAQDSPALRERPKRVALSNLPL